MSLPRLGPNLVLAVFFLSGAAGLAYEIVWARQLSLTLGISVWAVSATLAAFMGGLGAGAALSGRLLDKGAAPIRLYAVCEAALGVYVLLFPLAWAGMDRIYLAAHGGAEGATLYVITLRFLLASMVLIPPTMLMGATLPAIVRHYAAGSAVPPGTVYAVNTIGAMAGCAAAGFYMIEAFGLTNSLRAGAVVNLSCAAAAWAMAGEGSWRLAALPNGSGRMKKEDEAKGGLLLALYGITGFCGLALELLWTRCLILLLNNTTYAFSLVLSVFLLGTAAGSALAAGRKIQSAEKARVLLGWMMAGVGLMALFSMIALAYSGPAIGYLSVVGGVGAIGSFIPGGEAMAPALLFALVIIAPATALLGACFPLAVRGAGGGPELIGGGVGRLYAANTAGCVLGSLTAGYLLIPAMGAQASVLAVAALAILAGAGAAAWAGGGNRPALVAGALAAPMAVYFAINPDIAKSLSVMKLDLGAEVEFYEEGPSATVLVSKNETDLSAGRKPLRRLWINGDPIAGTFREALQLERLQAHIPLLLHPNPKTALVICFGTGSTAGAALAHGLDSVTAVDISREVFHAGPNFTDGNLNPIANPAFKMVEEDGRNFLKTTSRRFDFITSEPPPPSNAGVVSLYTVEYYRLARERLNPGGMMSQWIPIHHMTGEDLRRLVAAFLEVFPDGAMWYTKWDAIMIGAAGPMPGVGRLYGALGNPAVAASLADIGIYRPEQVLANYMMGPAQLRRYVGGVEPLRDDRPVVEFTAPRAHARGVAIKGENLAEILPYREAPEPGGSHDKDAMARAFESQTEYFRGQVAKSAQDMARAAGQFEAALKLDPDNSEAAAALLALNVETLYRAAGSQNVEQALRLLDRTEALDKRGNYTVQLKFLRGFLFTRLGRDEAAAREMAEAVRLDGSYFTAVVNLAGLYAQRLGRPGDALGLYQKALELGPSREERKALEEAINQLSRKGDKS